MKYKILVPALLLKNNAIVKYGEEADENQFTRPAEGLVEEDYIEKVVPKKLTDAEKKKAEKDLKDKEKAEAEYNVAVKAYTDAFGVAPADGMELELMKSETVSKIEADQIASEKHVAVSVKYTDLFGEDPEDGMSVEDMEVAISIKEEELTNAEAEYSVAVKAYTDAFGVAPADGMELELMKSETASKLVTADQDVLDKFKDVFKADPEDGLSIEEMKNMIASKEAEGKTGTDAGAKLDPLKNLKEGKK